MDTVNQTDWLRREKAYELAARIDNFWLKNGCRGVHARVEQHPFAHHENIFVVRSNLVAGLPPKRG